MKEPVKFTHKLIIKWVRNNYGNKHSVNKGFEPQQNINLCQDKRTTLHPVLS